MKNGEQKFQIENLFPNGGLVEPDFQAMSQKFYSATYKNGLVEPFPGTWMNSLKTA
jgi:hypothetical protein